MVDLEEGSVADQEGKDQALAVDRAAAAPEVAAAAEEVAAEAEDAEAIRTGAVLITVSSPASVTGGANSLLTPARFSSHSKIRR
jgi:hypothetical protein